MMYSIEVRSDPPWPEFEPALVKSAAMTLEHLSAEPGALTVVLTEASSIRDFNRTFAGEDHATDVLSFIDGTPDPDSGQRYYGDVIIAVDIAQEQAEKAAHSLIVELSLLTVHGVLHLLGYDHADAREKHEMWSAQEAILDSLEIELGQGHQSP